MDLNELTSTEAIMEPSPSVIPPLTLELSAYEQIMSLIELLRADVNQLKENAMRKRGHDTEDDDVVKKKSKKITVQKVFEKLEQLEMDIMKQFQCIIESRPDFI